MKKIKLLDAVHCKANAEARAAIKFALSYKTQRWSKGEFHMESEIRKQYLITGRKNTGGTFLTGLLPRIEKYCKTRNIDIEVDFSNMEQIPTNNNQPKLLTTDFKEFRPDQLQAIEKAASKRRGLIIAPTGSGKTIVAYGLVSKYRDKKIIFIMHTSELWKQAVAEAKKFSETLPPIYAPSGSQNLLIDIKHLQKNKSGLIICLIQSLAKIDPNEYITLFDITLVDEAHHISGTNSQYGKFMQHNLSPIRIGFTASKPTQKRQLLVNEGLLGPVITKLTIKKAIKVGIIAKPKVKIINVPFNMQINQECRRYQDFYQHGIINNKIRNDEIRKIVENAHKKNKPVLILIEKLEHGKNIQKIIKQRSNIDIPFIHGTSKSDDKDKYKQQLISGELNSIIASRIWMEGINIRNLKIIIYAAGMKEKKKTIQAMGRGLRTSKGKKTIILIDFLDPYRYLAEHSVLRLQTYNEEGWL